MSVTAAKGFEASGVAAGIRYEKKDVALVHSTAPAAGGAMFSRNKVQAACLQVNRAHLDAAEPQAVVVNSGVANSATGTAIVICAIDNLGKGAAGQAVQNANHALGLTETAGLRLHGVLV